MKWLLALVLVLTCGAAAAQMPPGAQACGKRADLVAQLQRDYHEQQRSFGQVSQSALIEIFVSDNGETWTIMATGSNGMSCVLSAGKNWQSKDAVRGADL